MIKVNFNLSGVLKLFKIYISTWLILTRIWIKQIKNVSLFTIIFTLQVVLTLALLGVAAAELTCEECSMIGTDFSALETSPGILFNQYL